MLWMVMWTNWGVIIALGCKRRFIAAESTHRKLFRVERWRERFHLLMPGKTSAELFSFKSLKSGSHLSTGSPERVIFGKRERERPTGESEKHGTIRWDHCSRTLETLSSRKPPASKELSTSSWKIWIYRNHREGRKWVFTLIQNVAKVTTDCERIGPRAHEGPPD